MYSGGGIIFGKSAGVTESVVRYIYATKGIKFDKSMLTDRKIWETVDKKQLIHLFEFKVGDELFRAVVATGGAAVEETVKIFKAGKFKGIDVIEIMMCPGGCIAGGGQPKLANKKLIPTRNLGLQELDENAPFTSALDNKKMFEYV